MTKKFVELTSFDRCDVNPVEQGRFLWIMPAAKGRHTGGPLSLIFCKHHSDKYKDELDAQGFELVANSSAGLTKRAVGVEVS